MKDCALVTVPFDDQDNVLSTPQSCVVETGIETGQDMSNDELIIYIDLIPNIVESNCEL